MKRILAITCAAVLGACSSGDSPRGPGEREPNDTRGQATPIAPGVLVPAVMGSFYDVDYFVFSVPAGGAWVRIETFDLSGAACSGVDTFTELFGPTGILIGWDDDSGPAYCDDLSAFVPAGTYYAAISNAGAAGPSFSYTLIVTLALPPSATPESEPNGSIETANGPFTADALISGDTYPSGDHDYFAVQNTTASPVTVRLETYEGAVGACPSADSVIDVYTGAGVLVARNDDGGFGWCSRVSVSIPAGTTYYARVSGYFATVFAYLLEIDFP